MEKIDSQTIISLTEALNDPRAKVRLDAAQALVALGDRRAVKPLIKALKDSKAEVRLNAAKAMGKLRDPHAVNPPEFSFKFSFISILDRAESILELQFVRIWAASFYPCQIHLSQLLE